LRGSEGSRIIVEEPRNKGDRWRARRTHPAPRKKLYAVRDAGGRFKDIQTYERAHRADLAKTSKAEAAEGKKKARKAAKKKAAKKR
jgi:hypothetical protein